MLVKPVLKCGTETCSNRKERRIKATEVRNFKIFGLIYTVTQIKSAEMCEKLKDGCKVEGITWRGVRQI
jgi:hypothetical protein